MTVRLHGSRVVLGPLTDDALPWLADEMRSWGAEAPEDRLRDRIRRSGTWDDHQIDLAVLVDGRLVGDVQARRCPRVTFPGHFEIGIGLFDAADRGQGIGTDAIRAFTRYLFEDERATRVQLGTDVDNAPMRAVAERIGYRLEGVMRGFYARPEEDRAHDYALYAMTNDDYEDVKRTWT